MNLVSKQNLLDKLNWGHEHPHSCGVNIGTNKDKDIVLPLSIARFKKILSFPAGIEQMYRARCYIPAPYYSEYKKVLGILGMSDKQLRLVPIDNSLKMDVSALEKMIQDDVGLGLWPFYVQASAPSMATNAIDDIKEIYQICEQYNCYLHLDARYCGPFILFDALDSGLEKDLALADSISFDLSPVSLNKYLLLKDKKNLDKNLLTDGVLEDPLILGFKSPQEIKQYLHQKLKLAKEFATSLAGEQHIEVCANPFLCRFYFKFENRRFELQANNKYTKELLEFINCDSKIHLKGTILQGKFVIEVDTLSFLIEENHVQEWSIRVRWGKHKILNRLTTELRLMS